MMIQLSFTDRQGELPATLTRAVAPSFVEYAMQILFVSDPDCRRFQQPSIPLSRGPNSFVLNDPQRLPLTDAFLPSV